MCRTGSSDKTVNPNCEQCMKSITVRITTATVGDRPSLSVPASRLFSLRRRERRYSSGAGSATIVVNGASTARSSAMRANGEARTLSERLTPLLIARGLVRGTTRMFGRRLSKAGIPAGVSFAPDGTELEPQKAASLF